MASTPLIGKELRRVPLYIACGPPAASCHGFPRRPRPRRRGVRGGDRHRLRRRPDTGPDRSGICAPGSPRCPPVVAAAIRSGRPSTAPGRCASTAWPRSHRRSCTSRIHPTVLAWAERSLVPDGGAIQVNDTQAIVIGPGERAQYLHRDQSAWPWFNQLLPDGPEVTVVAMVAMTDFTAGNGATRVVPFSHLQADSPELVRPRQERTGRDVRRIDAGLQRPDDPRWRRQRHGQRAPRRAAHQLRARVAAIGGGAPLRHPARGRRVHAGHGTHLVRLRPVRPRSG